MEGVLEGGGGAGRYVSGWDGWTCCMEFVGGRMDVLHAAWSWWVGWMDVLHGVSGWGMDVLHGVSGWVGIGGLSVLCMGGIVMPYPQPSTLNPQPSTLNPVHPYPHPGPLEP